MTRYRDGDDSAFDTLYERHRGGLYRFMLRQCGSRAVAEELYQDVWLSVIRVRASYTVSAKFTTWLYQMARNRIIDNHRRASIRPVSGAEVGSDAQSEPSAPDGEQPDRQAQSAQGLETLARLVDALPDEQREAFLLREEAGMSVQEIAECTGVNNQTAKSRLRYAVKKLRAGWSEHHE